jgi:hypothetical protein
MSHPEFDRLGGYVYELDENPSEVEAHLRGCAECALTALRLQRERSLLERALEVPYPARRRQPWTWAAAALLLVAVTAAALVQTARLNSLEREVAVLRAPESPSFRDTLAELCQSEVDRSVHEMVAHAELPADTRIGLREALSLAVVAPSDVFDRYLRGEVDEEALAKTDLLGSIERDLRVRLSPDQYQKVSDYLVKSRDAASVVLAERAGADMAREVGLTAEQRQRIESLLREKASWRLDIAFLPEAVLQIVAHSSVAAGETHRGIVAVLEPGQKEKFSAFLRKQRDALRRKYS